MNAAQAQYLRADANLEAANVRAAALCKSLLPPDFSEETCTDAEMERFVDARLEAEARIGYADTWAEYKRAKEVLLVWVYAAVCADPAYARHRADVEYLFQQAARNTSAQNKIVALALRLKA